MTTPYDTSQTPSSQEPDFEPKGSSFSSATGAKPLSTNPEAPRQQSHSSQQDEAANSAPPDTLGGLVDPNLAAFEDGT